jgi:16S rRNA (guanine1207-N2)-methyltransferase
MHAILLAVTHYFSEHPDVASAAASVDVTLPDVAFTMQTDRGVFSHGHVDTGTSLLLREAPPPPPGGNLLDLGCGAGPIALTLAKRAPDAVVWAVDTNERARQLTMANAAANGVSTIRVAAPDELPDDVRFGAIWSNPPIRIGKDSLHELLLAWLNRLEPEGVAVLVVQKHLGADSLQRWLTDQGFPTDRIASKAGFRLLRVENTTSPGS